MIVSGNRVRKAWPYIVTAAPGTTPVTLAEAKAHLKVSDATDDTLITSLIKAATDYAEKYTGRDLINRTYQTYRDDFCDSLELRRAPISSVSAVEYLVAGVWTAVASTVWQLNFGNDYRRLSLKVGQIWPTNQDAQEQAVRVTFVAGYGAATTDVPEEFRQGILQHVLALYENRGDCADEVALPPGAAALYDMYRIRSIWS